MRRSIWTVSLLGILCVLIALPALAADPSASKRFLGKAEGSAVLAVQVSAGSSSVYGVTVEVSGGSLTDLVAPKGWVGIATSKGALFITDSKPIAAGKSAMFRLYTTDRDADLSISFRDDVGAIGNSQSI